MILYENGLHNHDSRMAEDTVADTVSQAVEKAVENPTVAPRKVMQEITNTLISDPSMCSILYYVSSTVHSEACACNIV